MFDFIALLKTFASIVIPQSLYRFASRILGRGIRRVANAIANTLHDWGYHRAARTVRHIARYLVDWGAQLVTFFDQLYGEYQAYANVLEEVDEVEIEGDRYSVGGQTYWY